MCYCLLYSIFLKFCQESYWGDSDLLGFGLVFLLFFWGGIQNIKKEKDKRKKEKDKKKNRRAKEKTEKEKRKKEKQQPQSAPLFLFFAVQNKKRFF